MTGLHGRGDLALARAVYANFCQMWREVGAAAADTTVFDVQQRPDMLLVRSNYAQRVPHMILDPVVPLDHVAEWASRIVRELADGIVSLMVTLPPGMETGALAGAMRREGFLPASKRQVSMACTMVRGHLNDPDDPAIQRASDVAQLDLARGVLARVFGLPASVSAYYTPPELVETLLCYDEGSVVGVACLCPFAGSAGVYSVAVLPAYRGRGYARRLVNRMLVHAARRGYDTAVLSCERHLIPLYQRLGFRACWEPSSYWLDAWWR